MMSYASLIFAFVICVCRSPVAPSTLAAPLSLLVAANPPVVLAGKVAPVTYVSGCPLLS